MRRTPIGALFVLAALLLPQVTLALPVLELTDDTFDETVFPPDVPFAKQKPFLIMFYAPWCGHCKATKPIFQNATDVLDGSAFAKSYATFAWVDATVHKRVAARFHIKSFPTLYYTVHGRGYHYDGARQLQDFLQTAVYVFRGFELGSFADDVSSPQRFEMVDKEAPGRAAFVIFIPKTSPKQHEPRQPLKPVLPSSYDGLSGTELEIAHAKELEEGVPSLWHVVVESAITLGKARFAVIYEDRLPVTVAGDHALFSRVMDVAKKCVHVSKGPNGEALVLVSDAHRQPQCYSGTWLDKVTQKYAVPAGTYPAGLASLAPTGELREWLDRNAFLAVEEISAESYTALSRRPGLLLVFAAKGPLTKEDTDFLPALRDLVQERNARYAASQINAKSFIEAIDTPAPKHEFIFSYLDGFVFKDWCKEHGLTEADLPAVLAVSPMKQLAYHAKDIPEFVSIKDEAPWKIGGPQQEQIRVFMKRIDEGSLKAFRASTIGRIAEFILDTVPYATVVHQWLGGDDTSFLTVIFMITFSVFVIFLALRPDRAEDAKFMREAERHVQWEHRQQALTSQSGNAAKNRPIAGSTSAHRRQAEKEE